MRIVSDCETNSDVVDIVGSIYKHSRTSFDSNRLFFTRFSSLEKLDDFRHKALCASVSRDGRYYHFAKERAFLLAENFRFPCVDLGGRPQRTKELCTNLAQLRFGTDKSSARIISAFVCQMAHVRGKPRSVFGRRGENRRARDENF